MWTELSLGGPKLRRPLLLVCVSTSLPQYRELYSQARELAGYMLKAMEFRRIGTMRSSALGPEVVIDEDGLASLPECRFDLHRGRRDLVLFSGDASPGDDQIQFSRELLEAAKKAGVREVVSVGARWTENPLAPDAVPAVKGFATDAAGVARLRKCGIEVVTDEPAPFFASVVVGLAGELGMKGYKLSVDHGEPRPHVRSVWKLAEAVTRLAGVPIPVEELRAALPTSPPPKEPGQASIYQ